MGTTEQTARPSGNRALVVGIRAGEAESAARSADELSLLVNAAGIDVARVEIVPLRTPHPSTLIGSGTIDRLSTVARDAEADILVFDTELHPRQQRNLERSSALVITDRHAVILEIFARRASTREAKLQVELARVEYELPRLAGKWQHLSRQGGGSRLARGEGEKQIEADRRIVMRRATAIRRDLKRVERQRDLRRKRRESQFRAALVGYTNAGKTTLLNAITGSRAYAANQLFATLDPVSRSFTLPDHPPVIVTDTVGFVRRLPHGLVKAFHSTLEEAIGADLLLYVVDASDPEAAFQLETTLAVVRELNAANTPSIVVLNKIDRCVDPAATELSLRGIVTVADDLVTVSAKTGAGVPALRTTLGIRADDRGRGATP